MDRPPRKMKFHPQPPRKKNQEKQSTPIPIQIQKIFQKGAEDEAKPYNEDDIDFAKQPDSLVDEPQRISFQFPKGEESSGSSSAPPTTNINGQLLKYKSGALKLKIGDTLYDVNPRTLGDFVENVIQGNKKIEPPIFLPMRRPKPGDTYPKDFWKPGEDEDIDSAPIEIGLLDEPERILFQFPRTLPLGVPIGGELGGSSSAAPGACALEECPKGRIGKLLMYKNKSGIKYSLQIGEILYDVDLYKDKEMDQDVIAVNTTTQDCVDLGDLKIKGVVALNLDYLDDIHNDEFVDH